MDLATILKVLHVIGMFSAVTILVGGSIYFERIARTEEPRLILAAHRSFKALENLGVGLLILAIVFGVATAIVARFDLTRPWLLIAYVLTAALFVLGPMESARYGAIVRAAEAAEDGRATPELRSAVHDRGLLWLSTASVVLYVAIIIDMVAKPLG